MMTDAFFFCRFRVGDSMDHYAKGKNVEQVSILKNTFSAENISDKSFSFYNVQNFIDKLQTNVDYLNSYDHCSLYWI
jgi:hypothetical protein